MYTILLFLLLLANVFTTMSAMDDIGEKFPFHKIVDEVANGRLGVELAKTNIKELFFQDKDPNKQNNFRTAGQLSAYYCVNFAGSSEKQFDLLTLFLDHDSAKSIECNKKRILEDLDEVMKRLIVSQRGLDKAPFKRTKVSGGGSCINDAGEDENKEQVKNKENRINRVRELLEKPKN